MVRTAVTTSGVGNQRRFDENPQAIRQRRETVEHPFGTIKARMGATHFLMKTLPRVPSEMALHVLAYGLTRVISIMGHGRLIAATGHRLLGPRLSRDAGNPARCAFAHSDTTSPDLAAGSSHNQDPERTSRSTSRFTARAEPDRLNRAPQLTLIDSILVKSSCSPPDTSLK
jgi:hypothetical protein